MTATMTASVLSELVAHLASGAVRVIDLSQTLSPDFPQISLPPEMGQCAPFRIEEISKYDERGPGWYWNNISCGEHTGTHFDAPIHWISGRNLPNNSTDTIPPEHFLTPACVIDCSQQPAPDADFLPTADFLRKWEDRFGRIPRSCADAHGLVKAHRSRRLPELRRDRPAHAGPTPMPFAFSSKSAMSGFGRRRSEPTPVKAIIYAHPTLSLLHARPGRYGLQCLTNLDLLPATGAVVFAAPSRSSAKRIAAAGTRPRAGVVLVPAR